MPNLGPLASTQAMGLFFTIFKRGYLARDPKQEE